MFTVTSGRQRDNQTLSIPLMTTEMLEKASEPLEVILTLHTDTSKDQSPQVFLLASKTPNAT
jgi:hypothetical protein